MKSGDNGKREEWDLQTRPTKKVRNQGTCRTPTFPTKSNARTLSLTMRSVISKRWPTRPFSLNLLGSEAGFLILREIERQRDRQAKPNKECFNLDLFLSAGNHRVSPFLGESLHVGPG